MLTIHKHTSSIVFLSHSDFLSKLDNVYEWATFFFIALRLSLLTVLVARDSARHACTGKYSLENSCNVACAIQICLFTHARIPIGHGPLVKYAILIFIFDALLDSVSLFAKERLPHRVVEEMEHRHYFSLSFAVLAGSILSTFLSVMHQFEHFLSYWHS